MAYEAYNPNEPLPEFELARKRVGQKNIAATQMAQDAITRRFAAMGGLNSGSYIKQQQLLADTAAQREQDALEGIGAAEAAARRGLMEQERSRGFASAETEKQRQFAAGQADIQRKIQQEQFGKSFDLEKETKLGALDIARKEQEMDRQTLIFNKALAAVEQGDFKATGAWMDFFEGRGPRPGTYDDDEGISYLCTGAYKNSVISIRDYKRMGVFMTRAAALRPKWVTSYLLVGRDLARTVTNWVPIRDWFVVETLRVYKTSGLGAAMDHYADGIDALHEAIHGRAVPWQYR